eukprot:6183657-Pleurochrysis_carterae.AAC.1
MVGEVVDVLWSTHRLRRTGGGHQSRLEQGVRWLRRGPHCRVCGGGSVCGSEQKAGLAKRD